MHIEVLSSISQLNADAWNNLFAADYPFCRHEFLQALELGGSVGKGTGWLPQHLLLWDGSSLLAAAPAYRKRHSYGEYLFDRVFAEAYQRHGLRYYPKLLLAVPFTPAEGPRLGIAKGVDPRSVLPLIQQCLHQSSTEESAASTQLALSHWQCLYAGNTEQALFRAAGWLERFDVQFEWQNPAQKFVSFEQFLATLTARKRKQIRKERALVQQQGLQLRTLTGDDLDAAFWLQFYQFYVATYLKRSGHQGYLTEQTFLLWGRTMAAQIVVFSAWQGDELVAASLCFRSNDKLYGRYWGCSEAYSMLHFECCYYAGIDYCIAQGLTAFDAGAQGEHKLQRGFVPVIRSGFYRFLPSNPSADPASVAQAELEKSMHSAIANYCLEEQSMVLNYQQQARSALPFANSGAC
ncbi:GNAT family N-acetyltransferase [Rheinheimera riviphila]|uniref:GNAT family N-acetyltransferase n=1 Tax=Rheinheimera riviphila TaxID=1834037 RepID=A0A437QLJ5_9GAMM|nr:GNAT family N-acetyltransferase [Rheinheimera riviphila]RVU35386.1 GNAT family N-acetyltransferase [Rheinheimera riviphila]